MNLCFEKNIIIEDWNEYTYCFENKQAKIKTQPSNELNHIKCNHRDFKNISLTHNLCNPNLMLIYKELQIYEQHIKERIFRIHKAKISKGK